MLSVKQGGMKYHFLSLYYDSTGDWSPVSWTIREHFTHKPSGPKYKYIKKLHMKDSFEPTHNIKIKILKYF